MVRVIPTWLRQANERGQVVLLAALVLAVAILPIVAAYLQLGYGGATSTAVSDDRPRETQRLLERTVEDATAGIPSTYDWQNRSAAAERVRERIDPTAATLEQSQLEDRVTHQLSYNQSRGVLWASENCPRGPDRQFGKCESIDGIVVQDRAGQTHVLAVAVDLSTTGPDSERSLTTVIHTPAQSERTR